MNKWIFTCSLLLTAICLHSCKEDEKLMYEEDSRVYFYKRLSPSIRDSVVHSFAFDANTITSDTLELRFRIIGFPKNYDRSIPIKIKEGSTAKLGYHFKLDKLYIPANSSDASVDLVLYRRAGLKDSVVNAELQISENEFFKSGYKDFDNGSELDRLTYRISLTDKLLIPTTWATLWNRMFGEYSETKILFLAQLLNYTDWNVAWLYPQDESNMINKARIGIYEYEKANGPLIDENNNRVVIP